MQGTSSDSLNEETTLATAMMKIEFMPWYDPGQAIMRCGGDDGCGVLLVEGDIELHRKHHQRVQSAT